MLTCGIITLAAGVEQLIMLVIVGAFALASWVLKQSKQSQQSQRPNPPNRPAPPVDAGPPGSGTPNLDELAERRRRELAALAQRRTQMGPANLTLAESRQRAQAKAAYERRAAELRAQAGVSAPTPVAPPPMRMPLPSVPRQAPSRPVVRQPARQPVRPTVRQAQRPVQIPTVAARPPQIPVPAPAPPTVQQVPPVAEPLAVAAVASAKSVEAYEADARPRLSLAGKSKSLRQAIVLMEVLGPPVALRQ